MGKFDHLFQEKNVYTPDLYCNGIYPAAKTDTDTVVKKEGESEK